MIVGFTPRARGAQKGASWHRIGGKLFHAGRGEVWRRGYTWGYLHTRLRALERITEHGDVQDLASVAMFAMLSGPAHVRSGGMRHWGGWTCDVVVTIM